MNKKNLIFLAATAFAITGPAAAQPVIAKTKTYVAPKDIPGLNKVNFSAFDLNNDGILTMGEVGHKLFFLFDQDGNEMIDNIEFNRRTVMTIIPMEKQTFRFVDFNGDGVSEERTYGYDEFVRLSGLIRFDDNGDGLSAADFIEHGSKNGYQDLDDDDDGLISLEEWTEAYIESRRPMTAEPERYND